jgi:hypothetical protein
MKTSMKTSISFVARFVPVSLCLSLGLAGCATTTPPVAPAAATPAASAAAPAAAAPATAAPRPPAPAAPAAGAAPAASAASAGGAAAAAGTPPAGAAAARPGEPPPPRAFADVIREAKETKGLFTTWQKDERMWLEIRPEQLEQPFLLTWTLARGLGQMPFVPGLLDQERMAMFKRVGNQIQLLAVNQTFRAPAGSPIARAVRDSTSNSLLAAVPVASAAHPERKSILIDANAMWLGDLSGVSTLVDAVFRVGYALDRGNSAIERVAQSEQQTTIVVNQHYAVPKMPAPPVTPPPPGTPLPTPPRATPDPRSFFLAFQYRLVALPNPPMVVRPADERVGYFHSEYRDLATDYSLDPRVRVATRWRLEKQDPAAALSPPKQPIVALLDRNIPVPLRKTVEAGVLEWNKAFERAGFKDAIVVRQQPDEGDADVLEGRHLAVKWYVDSNLQGASAIGPSQVDPRTGEILYGAALIPEVWARFSSQRFGEVISPPAQPASLAELLQRPDLCSFGVEALQHAAFSFELMVERGEFARESAEATTFVDEAIKEVVMHEVGHALGLRHNFKASSTIKFSELANAAFTAKNGLSASIMDYVPENIPLATEPKRQLQMTTLGEYDLWAIEWGYTPLAPAEEKDALERIAARSAVNPRLAFATDEDAGGDFGNPAFPPGIDPLATRFDLGEDPLAYHTRQFALARELWSRTQTRKLAADDDYRLSRRNLERGINSFRASVPGIAKYVGGTYVNRDRAGSGRPLLMPVEPERQRAALKLLAREVFAVDSFRFSPQFMQRLGLDQFARFENNQLRSSDFSLPSAVLDMQRGVLDQLTSDTLALRLANAESRVTDPRTMVSYAEVQSELTNAIWSELKSGREIDSMRRNLQREHARRLATGLIRPAAPVAADVRAVHRQVALRLEADLRRAAANPKFGATTRAHLADTQALLAEALRATLIKQGA